MDFGLTAEQSAFKKSVFDFAKKELVVGSSEPKTMRERDKASSFFREGFEKCAAFGILGLPVPERYGGLERDVVDCALAMQALGRGCPDSGLLFTICSHVLTCEIPILLFGSEAQKQRYLPRMVTGEIIGCHAMSEPEAGSDAFSLTATAERRGDHFVLNGQKTFISNAPVADVFLVFATTNRAKGWAGVTGFLVERGTKGLSVGKPLDKMGLKTSPTGEVTLEDVEVPVDAVLGKVGQGSAIFNAEMEWERSCLFAIHLGAMERQLDDTIRYAQDRKQFGQPIGGFQAVSHKIADMKVRIELAELVLLKVAWMKSRGVRAPLESAISKLFVSESFVQSSLDAIQIRGGYGFMSEYEVERDLRDAIGSRIYSGTNEIQKNIIASLLGL
ncbi:MAG: acyl-CoA dehydrogenase [Polyangiaceae bacterium]|nr:acyl-CoA dehydrogenase [Polyangiaceae bacterium]